MHDKQFIRKRLTDGIRFSKIVNEISLSDVHGNLKFKQKTRKIYYYHYQNVALSTL